MNELAKQIHQNAIDKGFWDGEKNVGELLMLCVSELGEALEAHRKDRMCNLESISLTEERYRSGMYFERTFEHCIKDSFQDELADTIIRILDMCAAFDIDIEKHIDLKMAYNKTRERLHGKRY